MSLSLGPCTLHVDGADYALENVTLESTWRAVAEASRPEAIVMPERTYRALVAITRRHLYGPMIPPIPTRKSWVTDKDWTQRQARRRRR